jgi:hypothetical protein
MDAKQKLLDLAVSETGFVFDPYTGTSFNTNTSGRTILNCLKEGQGRDQLLMALQDQFEVGNEDLNRDLDEFIYLLRENGILPADFEL